MEFMIEIWRGDLFAEFWFKDAGPVDVRLFLIGHKLVVVSRLVLECGLVDDAVWMLELTFDKERDGGFPKSEPPQVPIVALPFVCTPNGLGMERFKADRT